MAQPRSGAELLEAGQLAAARGRFWAEATDAEAAGDASAFALAALGLGGIWVHEHRATVERARVLALQRRALAQPGLDPRLARRLRARLAAERAYADGDGTELWAALDAARHAEDPVALAECLSLAHHCILGPHHRADRMALADELVATAALTGRRLDALMGLMWRTVDLVLAGDRRAARLRRELEDQLAVEPCAALGYVVAAQDVTAAMRAGDLAGAEAGAEACLRLGEEVGDADALGFYGAQLVAIRWMAGRGAELLGLLVDLDQSTTVPEGTDGFIATLASLAAAAGDDAVARRALARLRARGLDRLPSSSAWMATVTGAVEAAFLLDDAEVAATAYRLLAPFAELPVMASLGVACYGSAQRPLGLAAATTGQLDRAVDHLEAAVMADLALGNEPCHAISQAALAEVLERRGRPEDVARAGAVRAEAIAEAGRLGLAQRAQEWAACASRRVEPALTCSRRGNVWTIGDGDRSAVVPDSVGMDYLARLIACPDTPVPAVELASGHAISRRSGPGQPVLDATAKAAYRRRAEELRAEVDDADRCADLVRAARARAELDALVEELSRATGLLGRSRTFADTPERARTSVRKALRRALASVAAADEELAAELESRLVTGNRCTFVSGGPSSPVARRRADVA